MKHNFLFLVIYFNYIVENGSELANKLVGWLIPPVSLCVSLLYEEGALFEHCQYKVDLWHIKIDRPLWAGLDYGPLVGGEQKQGSAVFSLQSEVSDNKTIYQQREK